uniref:Uncharacterized protein n=1 Tax=Romanomermis culicivorax TaxID=13658 RepID=A0A915KK19_ROMCU
MSLKKQMILQDNGSNMVTGFQIFDLPSLLCLAHIIQNDVNNDGLGKSDSVIIIDGAKSGGTYRCQIPWHLRRCQGHP